MIHTPYYLEMNQAVPGGTSLSPGHEGAYGECQVPSPSQWSDPCYSPPSFHSPQHLPGELEKVKEEPFSPSPPSCPNFPPSPQPHHHVSPYGRPQQQVVAKKEAYETSLNLSELLAENQVLTNTHQQLQPPPQHTQTPQYAPYSDHPLLRGCLEDNTYQKKIPMPPYKSPTTPPNSSPATAAPTPSPSSDGLGFLDMLMDVKQEIEDDVTGIASCASPPAPAPVPPAAPQPQPQPQPMPVNGAACQRDILETVEQLALEHARRDVQRVSDSLNIPRDPAQWSVADVRAWLDQQAAHLQLPPLMLHFWNYGGPELLKLTEAQFRQLAPVGGELLYAQLEIWRSALRATPKMLPQHHQWSGQQSEMVLASFMLPPPPQQQQQQVPQVESSSQGGSPPHMGSPNHLGSPGHLGSPSSPPLSLPTNMGQVPTPVVQVTQQQQQQQQHLQAVSGGSCSPPSAQGQPTGSGVFLEEQCLNVAALLQRQSSSESSHSARLPAHSPQEDGFDSEEEVEDDPCTTTTTTGGRGGTHIHLWQFLKELLQQPQLYGSCIRWLDRQKGVFKIEDSVRVARLWGKRKNRPAMNYDKLSRSIRQYYKKGIMKKTERSQRLVYQFCHPYSL